MGRKIEKALKSDLKTMKSAVADSVSYFRHRKRSCVFRVKALNECNVEHISHLCNSLRGLVKQLDESEKSFRPMHVEAKKAT